MKNIILFVNSIPVTSRHALQDYEKETGEKLQPLILVDNKLRYKKDSNGDIVVRVDTRDSSKVTKALRPYYDKLVGVVSRSEKNLTYFARIIPNIPYLRTPTAESLRWASSKILMRNMLRAYDKKIAPNFLVVKKLNKKTIKEIKEKIGFPLVIKPSGLAASVLVSICYHEEELEKNLQKTFKKIKKVYKDKKYISEPEILVEQFMEGDMYSIDGYVSQRGNITFCPLVHVKTGKNIGFDDFFGYIRTTPVSLKKTSIEKAEEVAKDSVHALGLRSTSVHIELMRFEDEWKIIELTARLGGFRDKMYRIAYGINHPLNDILIRLGKKVVVPRKTLSHVAVINFFSEKEGTIKKLEGVNKVKKLESFSSINIGKKIGERSLYAKNGGSYVVMLRLANKSKEKLQSDIRRAEQSIKIVTK